MAAPLCTLLSPALGARVTGAFTPTQLHAALLEHQVLFVPKQQLSPAALLELAHQLGQPAPPHPLYGVDAKNKGITVLESYGDTGKVPDTAEWHADMTFLPEPPVFTVLHAQILPSVGGDTLWASTTAAYDALPSHLKNMLEGLSAVHDFGSFRSSYANEGHEAVTTAAQKFGQAVHPVVRVHENTGKKALYVNEGFTNQIVGMDRGDSNQLLSLLYKHLAKPEFSVRHRWCVGDLVLWDNRSTQHYAVADYDEHRKMHRVLAMAKNHAENSKL